MFFYVCLLIKFGLGRLLFVRGFLLGEEYIFFVIKKIKGFINFCYLWVVYGLVVFVWGVLLEMWSFRLEC